MAVKRPKKLKIITKEERESSIKKARENGYWFEIFMIEIGQWKKTGNGLEQCGEYLGTKEIERRFKAWKAKK